MRGKYYCAQGQVVLPEVEEHATVDVLWRGTNDVSKTLRRPRSRRHQPLVPHRQGRRRRGRRRAGDDRHPQGMRLGGRYGRGRRHRLGGRHVELDMHSSEWEQGCEACDYPPIWR